MVTTIDSQINRRTVLAGVGAGAVASLAGCATDGVVDITIQPGGLHEECQEINELPVDRFIEFTANEEVSAGGVSRTFNFNSYLATYVNDWTTMAVATFPRYVVGGVDLLPFNQIDPEDEELLQELLDLENIENVELVAEQEIENENEHLGETTAYEYEVTFESGDVVNVILSEFIVEEGGEDGVRVLVFGVYSNAVGGNVPQTILNMTEAVEYPSEQLRNKEAEQQDLFDHIDEDDIEFEE